MQEFEGGFLSEGQENEAVKDFVKILHRAPQASVWKGRDGCNIAECREIIEAAYEEDGEELNAILLKTEERRVKESSVVHMSSIRFGKFNEDESLRSLEKTIAEQLRDIAKTHGNPTRIHYTKMTWENYSGKKGVKSNFSSISFPFSKISEELGVE